LHATSSIEWSNLECRLRTRSGGESRRLREPSAVSWVYAPTPRGAARPTIRHSRLVGRIPPQQPLACCAVCVVRQPRCYRIRPPAGGLRCRPLKLAVA
jgi:hypothetical protein